MLGHWKQSPLCTFISGFSPKDLLQMRKLIRNHQLCTLVPGTKGPPTKRKQLGVRTTMGHLGPLF